MERDQCEQKAQEIRAKFNPENLSPFPYENIQKENKDLSVDFFPFDGESTKNLSGAITFDEGSSHYNIYINTARPQTRQYFTVAHELGHYFLHKIEIQDEGIIVDAEFFDGGRALFRIDDAASKRIETEANHFAAALIMPAVEECARVFNVSVSAMSIRLERLKLIPV